MSITNFTNIYICIFQTSKKKQINRLAKYNSNISHNYIYQKYQSMELYGRKKTNETIVKEKLLKMFF